MKIIGLDLSTHCTGYSIFENGKLIKYGQIKPKITLTTYQKIEYITREFINIFKNENLENTHFVIEDIYLGQFAGKSQVTGFANLGRMCGSIMGSIFLNLNKNADNITIIEAIEARPKVGLSGHCKKAEVQSWVLRTFKGIETDDYEALIDAVYAEKILGEISKTTFDKRIDDISKIIEEETQISEDQADAILLGYMKVLTNP